MADLRRVFGIVIAAALASADCGILDKIDGPSGLAIQKFSVSPNQIASGGTATLSWDVAGADSVLIDNGIGSVAASGSATIRPSATTVYAIQAKAGTSTATASVQVLVGTALLPSPSPSPSPGPSASPTPSPAPSSTPSPSPTPVPPPTPVACGAPAGGASGCSVVVKHQVDLGNGECVEVTRVAVSQGCPVAVATTRSVSFDVQAYSNRPLRWRRTATTSDVVLPGEGSLTKKGSTSVVLNQIVLDQMLNIEILRDDTQVIILKLRNY